MNLIEVKGLKCENKNRYKKLTSAHESIYTYDVEFKCDYQSKIGVYSTDKEITKTFLKYISGINKPQFGSIKIQNRNVYDNPVFFKKRLYLDYDTNYLNTLNSSKIASEITEKFDVQFDKDRFDKITKDLNIRGECEITNKYNFTLSGNTLVNFALSVSCNQEFLIINNPTVYLKDKKILDYITSFYDKNYKSLVFGLNKIDEITSILDYILIFDDYGKSHILDKNDKLIITNKTDNDNFDKYKIFESYDNKRLILLGYDQKEIIKELKKNKMEYIVITLSEIGGYL